MKRLSYMVSSLILSLLLWWSFPPGLAMAQGDSPVKYILMDTFYGMVSGALVGTAVSAPQSDPDWQENIGSGAAIGAIAGLIFGVINEGKPLLESKAILDVENPQGGNPQAGNPQVKFQLPTLQTSVQQDEEQQPQINYQVDLVSYRF